MKRSDLIATVLVNSGISFSLSDAHLLIRKTFEDEITDRKYETWNIEVDNHVAESLINTIGVNSNLNLHMFILDLEKFHNGSTG